MKRTLSLVLSLIMVLGIFASIPVTVDAASISNLTLKINYDNKSYCVDYCNTEAMGSLVIPSTYNGKPITSISSLAFSNCKNLTSITVPNSVKNIGWKAFSNCTSLTSIVIPNSVTSIDSYAFEDCKKLTSISIPSAIKKISEGVFWGCTSLTSIIIPDGVKEIGPLAFYSCTKLSSITIPNNVTQIGYNAFQGCISIASVKMSNKVRSIGGFAFGGCRSLASITIPSSVTYIGECAFADCSKLSSISIPNAVTSIGRFTFRGCTSLVYAKIGNSVNSIANGAFSGCTKLSSITIPDSVTSVGEEAFFNCASLTSVIIGSGVASIAYSAFDGCIKLKDVYYVGTRYQWDNISISVGNDNLIEANFHYNYVSTPQTTTINTINGIKVSWNAISGAVKYVVYKRLGTSSTWSIIATTTGTSYEDIGTLKAGKYYVYSVKAYNSAGKPSDYIKSNCATVQRVVAPYTKAANAINGINVTWGKVAGATKYVVLRRIGTESTWKTLCTTTGTSFLDKNVTPGIYYIYSIRAVNGTGYSEYDINKRITIQRILTPKASAVNKSNGIQISWNTVTSATKYNVYRRIGGTSTWIYVGTTTGISLIDTGVVKGKSYAYSIRAINGTGYSAYNSSKCAAIKRT